MLFAGTPPAVLKPPPTYISLPLIRIAETRPTPLPRAAQLLPFHLAIPFAATPPAVVKPPPTYISLPLIAIALTWPFIPSVLNLSSQFSSPDARGEGDEGEEVVERGSAGGGC